MLSGEYLTFDLKSRQGTGGSPSCRLCHFPVENLQHVLSCPATSEPRIRIQREMKDILCDTSNTHTKSLSESQFNDLVADTKSFAQFCVDCTSFNLPDSVRININDARLPTIFSVTRDMCYSVHVTRLTKLKELATAVL